MLDSAPLPDRAAATASGLYLNGSWHDGADRLAVTDPATGAPVGEVVAAGAAEARAAVEAAHAAFPGWAALPPDERAAPLRRAHALVLERAGELARALTLEGGKPLAEAEGEVRWGAEFLLWYAEEIRRPWGEILAANSPPSGSTCAAGRAAWWPASRPGTSPAR